MTNAQLGSRAEHGFDIRERAYKFGLRVTEAMKKVRVDPVSRSMVSQLVRSSTSIGANLVEADAAPTRKDFRYKIAIALKEAKESVYWIKLLKDSNFLSTAIATELCSENEEIVKILASIRNKATIE